MGKTGAIGSGPIFIVIPDLIRDPFPQRRMNESRIKSGMTKVYWRQVSGSFHPQLRHSRESGNPGRASADPTLGSRFRGNDKDLGTSAPHPNADIAVSG
jgi:hypothetical protein